MRRRKAFTWVEVLVVIAVICILIALILPAINAVTGAKEAGKNIKTVEVETGEWKQIDVPMVWNSRNLLYTTMEIEGQRYLIVTRASDEGGVSVVPILPGQAERE